MRMKKLTREAMLRNINGLSVGDRAYCGPYGTITCTNAASEFSHTIKACRKFSVAGNRNGKLNNRGNYTMNQLRTDITR